MIDIKENVNIKDYTTLKIGGQFRYFVEINKVQDFPQFYAIALENGKYKNLPVFILGGGSNIIFPDGVLEALVLKINILGFEIVNTNDDFLDIKVGAGENWDNFVSKTVEMNLSGVEALSAIPGTVGATPVQNVGAYGSEVKDTIVEVEVFDTQDKNIKILNNKDCKFDYRDSIFKNESKGRYIITNVVYRLSKFLPRIPDYPGVKRYLIDNNINNPHLKEIREAIIYIRSEKLPNPKEIPNVGSFFKNPIIEKELSMKMKNQYDGLTTFPADKGKVKIPAGWLIENAGLKGKSFGKISVYDKNALVLVNNGNATKDDLMKAKNEIVKIVQEKFGITLEQEPEMI